MHIISINRNQPQKSTTMISKGRLFILFILFVLGHQNSLGQTCFDATSFGVVNNLSNNCGGDVVSRLILADGPYDPITDEIEARINWGDGSAIEDVLLTFNAGFGQWSTTATHTYADNGPACFYTAIARLRINNVNCTNGSDVVEVFDILVFDELDNPNVGTHDITHDASSAGGLNGSTDEVDVCENDSNPVRLVDNSEFNCTQANLDSPPQTNDLRNDEERWIQWVYGTNETITGDVIIDGVTVSTFPYHGPITFIGDNTPNPANDITLNMQFPTTAVGGEFFEVTLRSWNVCNPYDDNTGDANYLNPAGGIFDPTVEPVFGAFPNASEAPVTTTQIIRIVQQPLPPVVNNPLQCENDDNGNFNINASGQAGAEYTWYADAALTQILQGPNGDNTFNPVTQGPGGFRINKNVAVSTIFTRYVTQTVSGAATSCTSEPAIITIQIDALNSPGSISHPAGTTPISICAGDDPVAFTSPTPGTGGGPGGTFDYLWQSSTTSASAGFGPAAGTNDQETYDPPALATTTWFRRRVRSGECNDVFSNVIEFSVDQPITSGTIGNPQTICTGEDPLVVTNVAAPSGGDGSFTFLWQQASAIGGPYISAAGTNDQITYNPPVLTNTTFYRRVTTSGVCVPGSATSNIVEITVDQLVDPGTISNAQTICDGDNPAVLTESAPPSGGDGSYNITWEESNTGGGVGFSPATGINNLNTYDPPVLSSTTYYRRSVSSGTCPDAFSNEIEITVNPLPSATGPTGGGSICSGNPAPDIVWSLTGVPPFQVTYTDGTSTFGPIVENTNTFTLSGLTTAGNYEITALTDDNGCSSGSLGGIAAITVGGAAPTIDPPGLSLDINNACDDGASTQNPELLFSLDDANSASQSGFILLYSIHGGPTASINFDTDATGDPTAPIVFTEAVLNPPGSYTIDIISIESPAGCLTVVNEPLTFTVNPRPAAPTNPIDAISCSTGPINALMVDDPGAGFTVGWYTSYADPSTNTPVTGFDGTVGGSNGNEFTPATSADATFFAAIENDATGCLSNTALTVTHTEDIDPTQADADISTAAVTGDTDTTCDELYVLNANTASASDNETGTWSVGTPIYSETFSSADNLLGITGPANPPNTFTASNWSIDITNGIFANANDYFRVENGEFTAQDTDNNGAGEFVEWTSLNVDISAFPGGVDASVDASQLGANAGDGIELFYRLNSGALTPFDSNPTGTGAFGDFTATTTGVTGNLLQIIVRVELAGDGQFISFDNVSIVPTGNAIPIFDDVNREDATVSNLPIGTTTFTWTIESELGVCTATTSSIDITRNALPTAIDPVPQVCEDIGSTDATITTAFLSTLDNTVNSGNPTHTVNYYPTPARTPGNEISANFTVSNGDEIYTRVTRTDVTPQCTNDGIVTFQVNPLPDAVDHIYEVCEETVSSADVDNLDLPSLFNGIVTGFDPNPVVDRTVEWYFDPGGVVNGPSDLPIGNRIVPPADADIDDVFDGTVFYALITDTNGALSTSCQSVAAVEISVLPRAPARTFTGQAQVCVGSSFISYSIPDAAGSTYNWNIPADPNLVVDFGGGVNNRGVVLSFPTLSSPPASDFYTISVTETLANGCEGEPNIFDIEVQSSPVANPIVDPGLVCKGDIQNFAVTTPNPSNTYSWSITSGDAAIIGAPAGTGRSNVDVQIGTSNSFEIEVFESSNTGCSLGVPQTLVVNAVDVPVMSSDATFTMCSGESPATATPALNFSALPGGNSFSWRLVNIPAQVSGGAVNDMGTGDINQTLTNTSGSSAVVTYEVTPTSTSNPFCAGVPQTVFITVDSEPVMTSSNAETICSGDSPSLTFTSNVTGSTFAWTVTNVTGVTGTNIGDTGSTLASEILTNTNAVVGTVTYEVVPTGPATSNCIGATQIVTITVDSEPVGAGDTDSGCSGIALNYDLQDNVNTFGNSVSSNFRWVANDNLQVMGESLTPQTGDFIDDLIINTSGSIEVVQYIVTPINDANNCEGADFTIDITIESQPLGNPESITVCSDDGTNELNYDLQTNVNSAGGNSMPSTFTWIAADNPDPGVTGESLTIQSGAFITDDLVNTTSIDQQVVYTVIPTASSNSCVGEAFEITVTVNPEPVGVGENLVICSNEGLNYDLQNNINSLGNSLPSTFEWEAIDNPDVTGESVGIQTSAFITDNLVNTFTTSRFVTYNITPRSTSPDLCLGSTFTLTVEVLGEPTGAPDSDIACSGDVIGYNLQTQNVDILGNGLPSSFEWVAANNVNVSGESTTPQTGTTIDDVIINTTAADVDVIYTVTPTAPNGCDGQPFTVTITVQSDPQGFHASFEICSRDLIIYDLQVDNVDDIGNGGNGVNSDFVWRAVDNPNVDGESVTDQTGNIITDVLENVTGSNQVVNYTVTPTSTNGCTGASFQVAITVQSEPVAQDDVLARCSDLSVAYNLQNNVNSLGGNNMPSDFVWEVVADNPLVSGESVGPQTGNIITDVLNNLSGVNQIVEYQVTPEATNGCFGDPRIIEVTVNPEPVGADVTIPRCSRDNVAYDLQNNINTLGNSQAANFNWIATSNPNVSGESLSNRTTAEINDVLINTSGTNQTVIYTVTPTGTNTCPGNNFFVSVTVLSEPVGFPDNSFSECSDVILSYDLQANIDNMGSGGNSVPSTFSWVATPNALITGESVTPQTGGVINDVITNTTGFPQIASYRVTPTGTNGCLGDDFIVNITIDSEPVGQDANITICSQDNVTYNLQTQNINALGNNMPSSFTWIADADNPNVSGESLTSQSTTIISDALINTSGANEDVIYRVTPTSGGCVGNDFRVTVTVISEPVGLASVELSQQCSDLPFSFDPQDNINSGNGVTSNFTWTVVYDVGLTGGAPTGTGAGIINETLTNVTGGQLNAVYTVTPTSQTGDCPGSSFTITVPVDSEPLGVASVESGVCSGEPYPGPGYDPQDYINIAGGNSVASTFTWTASYATGITVISAGSGTGLIQETLENRTDGILNAVYTITPTANGTSCVGNPYNLTVRINPEPQGSDVTLTPSCSDVVFTISPQENINGNNSITSTFTWTANYNGLPGGAGSGNGQISESLTNDTGSTVNVEYTIIPTSNANGTLCEGDPFIITKPIDSEPLGADDSVTGICSDEFFDIDPQVYITNGQVSSFTWTGNYPSGLNNGVGSGIGNIAETLTNETSGPLTATYNVIPLNNGCTGNVFNIQVTIDPEPDAFNEVKQPAECSDVAFSFDPQNNILNGLVSTFTWTATYGAGLTDNLGNPLPASGTGIISATIQNLTTDPESAVYEITPTSGGCVGDVFTITVPVNPEPVGVSSTEASVCALDDFTLDLQSYISNSVFSTFSWTATTPAGLSTTGATSGSTNNINGSWINNTGGQLDVTYTITPRGLGSTCFGDDFTVTVPIDPSPVANDLTIDVCSDVPSTLVASGIDLTLLDATIDGGAGNTVTWFFDEFLNAPIPTPTSHTVFDGIPLYANVSDGTCDKTAVVIYNIQPLPEVVSVVQLDANGYALSCEGANDGQIEVTTSGASGPFDYELLKETSPNSGVFASTGFVISNPSANVTFVGDATNPITSGVYVVEVTENGSGSNCTGRSFPVVVSDPFPLNGGFIFGPQTICDGDTPAPFIQLAGAFGGVENYSYQWEVSVDGGAFNPIPGAVNETFAEGALNTSAPTSTTIYTYRRAVFSGSCSVEYSNEFDVTVNPIPQGDFEFYSIDDLAEFNNTSSPNPAPIPGNQICEGDPFFIGFDFTVGTQPFRFDYDDGITFNDDENGVSKTAVLYFAGISNDLTINLTEIQDVFGCQVTPSITKTLQVININPAIVVNNTPTCSGDPVNFTFNVDPNVEYTLNYGDGTSLNIPANSEAPGPFTTPDKVYSSGSLVNTNFQAILTAQTTSGPSCSTTSGAINVEIFANVFANINPELTSVCSGEPVLFQNNSLGVTNHNWFYREQGTTQQLDPRSTAGDQTFTFVNTTSTDPIIYEVVYTADNVNCDDQLIIPITVYKDFDADFDVTSVSVFNGTSEVTLNNLSVPVPPDDSFFTYEWNFGVDADPQTSTGYSPPAVVSYSRPGTKQITLTIINDAAQADGISCTSVHQEIIDIPLPPITAEFTISPDEGCPQLEVVTDNLSVGAITYDWTVRNGVGDIVIQSNEFEPVFLFNISGTYDVVLETSYPLPGGARETAISGFQTITVYENPVAIVQSNQQVVFIPDDPFKPINRSQGANQFNWDWGDGTPIQSGNSPQHFYDLPGEYNVILEAINSDNCSDTTSITVTVEEGGFTKTPNAFTPSTSGPTSGMGGNTGGVGSQLNDVFLPITQGVVEFRMLIFDRWGNLIFETNDKNIGWDGYNAKGKLLPAGVYVYKLELTLSNGQRSTRVGDVTLIR